MNRASITGWVRVGDINHSLSGSVAISTGDYGGCVTSASKQAYTFRVNWTSLGYIPLISATALSMHAGALQERYDFTVLALTETYADFVLVESSA
jgi:hypothetical protein